MNKLKLQLLFLLVATCSCAAAQEFYLLAGQQVTLIDKYKSSEGSRGFYGGVYSNLKLSKHIYFQPGLSFSQKGATSVDDRIDNIRANYLEMPLLLAFRMPDNTMYKFMVAAGPFIAAGVGGKVEFNDYHSKYTSGTFSSGTLRRFDYGLYVKLSAELRSVVLSTIMSIGELQKTGNVTFSHASIAVRIFDIKKHPRKPVPVVEP